MLRTTALLLWRQPRQAATRVFAPPNDVDSSPTASPPIDGLSDSAWQVGVSTSKARRLQPAVRGSFVLLVICTPGHVAKGVCIALWSRWLHAAAVLSPLQFAHSGTSMGVLALSARLSCATGRGEGSFERHRRCSRLLHARLKESRDPVASLAKLSLCWQPL